jgi:uracil-xanthine permease
MFKKDERNDDSLIYQLDGKPRLYIALPLGQQHVLAMFVGNLAPVLIISGVVSNMTKELIVSPEQKLVMVQCAMFVSGLATLLQLYPLKIGKFQVGSGLPIVMGTSFIFVPTITFIGMQYGLNAVFGATLLASFIQILFGIFLKPLKRFFPPVVIGCVLMSIGLNLLPVGVQYLAGGAGAQKAAEKAQLLIAAGETVPADVAALAARYGSWQNMLIGAIVVIIIVAFQRWGKGIYKASAILVGIIVGYIVAIALGQVDFTPIQNASVIAAPIPFYIRPEFHLQTAVSIAMLYIISSLETMGNVNGITVAAFNREATSTEVSGAVIADGVGCMFASIFGALPNTAFGQNAGLVAMTKVVNRWCIAMGAFLLILAGFFPKIGAMFSIMPYSVLGGAVITVFGMILINGMKLIYLDGLNERSVLIIAITFGIGYAISKTTSLVHLFPQPFEFIFGDTTIAVCFVALIANLVFAKREKKEMEASAV